VRNAIEASPSAVRIRVATERSGGRVRLSVADDGPGISTHDQRHIFDPFFTTRQDRGGTGLGLSITYGIIQDHGGSIEVESQLGRGTTFVIELPEAALLAPSAT
jgi:signal transduction histidine kinase